MKVELREEHSSPNPDSTPVLAARGDYREESLIGETANSVVEEIDVEYARGENPDVDEKKRAFKEKLFRRGHFGPTEHVFAFFTFEDVPIVVERQITRHRLLSWDIQSLRYCSAENADGYLPEFTERELENIDVEGESHMDVERDFVHRIMEMEYQDSFNAYEDLVDRGVPKEKARYILPLGTQIHGSFSGNARSLMHFIGMRKAGDCQQATINFATQVCEEFEKWAPETYKLYTDIVKGNSKKAP